MSSIIQARNYKDMFQGGLINNKDELIKLQYILEDEKTEPSDILNVNHKGRSYQEWNPRFQLMTLVGARIIH